MQRPPKEHGRRGLSNIYVSKFHQDHIINHARAEAARDAGLKPLPKIKEHEAYVPPNSSYERQLCARCLKVTAMNSVKASWTLAKGPRKQCNLQLRADWLHWLPTGTLYLEYSLSRATMLLSTALSHVATCSQQEKDKLASVTTKPQPRRAISPRSCVAFQEA